MKKLEYSTRCKGNSFLVKKERHRNTVASESPFESNFRKRGFRNDFSKKIYNFQISKQNILIFDRLKF